MSGPNRTESDQTKPVHPRRRRAYELLATGVAVRAIARELNVKHETVLNWRDSEEGQREIKAFAAKLADVREGVIVAAEKRLGALASRAVDTLGELLECEDPNVRLKAAQAIADRGGLPKTERVESAAAPEDLSSFSDEELELYERLKRRAKGAT